MKADKVMLQFIDGELKIALRHVSLMLKKDYKTKKTDFHRMTEIEEGLYRALGQCRIIKRNLIEHRKAS